MKVVEIVGHGSDFGLSHVTLLNALFPRDVL
jgi:hypothetical protein